jgi:membrane-associated phospholipid phosphatase
VSGHIGRAAAGNGRATVPPGPAAHTGRRQRRPTGAPPPLPHPVTITTTAWLLLVAVVLAGAFLASQHTPWLRLDDQASTWVLRWLAGIRTPWLTDVASGINVAGSGWGATVLGLSVVALTMAFRRWRHLLVFLGCLLFLEFFGKLLYFGLSRPRPYGVPIIGSWGGYSAPSPPVAVVAIFLMAAVYCLAVPGRPRSWTKAAVAAVVAVFGLARLYLGVDHPGDVLLGVAFAVAIAVTAFRFFTPNEVFPVAYRRGRTAHVDVTGRRGEAIRQAVRDQLGLTVTEIKPVGLESSAGSTPLRLRVEGGPDEFTAAVVMSEVLIGLLKGIYDRPRPPGSLVVTTGTSFPSGHAVAASVTVVAAVIALAPPGRRRAWWVLAAVAFSILMGLSRAYLGAHWLSDAVAGILLGMSCAVVTALMVGQIQRHAERRQRPA